MEKEQFWSLIIILSVYSLVLFFILDNLIYLRENIENKINGNCIYVNNEYYCKD